MAKKKAATTKKATTTGNPSAPRKQTAKKVAGTDSMSQMDAAVKVLTKSGEPMTTKQMIEAMAAKGYWTSPGGKTPWATLYSAITRELNTKGNESRFGLKTAETIASTSKTKPARKRSPKNAKPADGTPGPKSVSDLLKI